MDEQCYKATMRPSPDSTAAASCPSSPSIVRRPGSPAPPPAAPGAGLAAGVASVSCRPLCFVRGPCEVARETGVAARGRRRLAPRRALTEPVEHVVAHLGFGRIVGSEKEAPNFIENLV